MEIKAVVFDANGTLIDIRTDEHHPEVFRAAGHFLTYQGIDLRRHQVRDLYFAYLKDQRRASPHHHPEFDAVAIWRRIIDEHASDFTRGLPGGKRDQLPLFLAEMQRGISRRRLRLYPHVRTVLDTLRGHCALALVTDGQRAYARAELYRVGILDHFDPIVVSGDHGFRKPARGLFEIALDRLGVNAENAVYVGNDMYRDVYGARRIGMATVMFDSDQGKKHYRDCVPDFTIADHRELLPIVGIHPE